MTRNDGSNCSRRSRAGGPVRPRPPTTPGCEASQSLVDASSICISTSSSSSNNQASRITPPTPTTTSSRQTYALSKITTQDERGRRMSNGQMTIESDRCKFAAGRGLFHFVPSMAVFGKQSFRPIRPDQLASPLSAPLGDQSAVYATSAIMTAEPGGRRLGRRAKRSREPRPTSGNRIHRHTFSLSLFLYPSSATSALFRGRRR